MEIFARFRGCKYLRPYQRKKSPAPKDRRFLASNAGFGRDGLLDATKTFSRGAPLRGRCTPAIPARLRSERARKLVSRKPNGTLSRSVVFASPQKLVPFDCRNHSDRTFFARFGPLHAAEATYLYRPGHGDLIGQRQQDLNRRPFFDVLGEEEIDSSRAYIAGFGAGFTYCCSGCPPHRKW